MASDIFSILKEEHKLVKKGIKDSLEKDKAFEATSEALRAHMEGEESSVYPVFEDRDDLKPLIKEAFEEHKHVKMILDDLSEMDATDEEYKPKLKVLYEMVEHHVNEEEGKIFPKAKKSIDKDQLKLLTEDYLEAKSDSEISKGIEPY